MDSVPQETPIRDVADRCHVWESHADPAVRRVDKPSPDPVYLAYAVGDANNNIETTKVAMVTGQRSSPNQLEDLLRWVLAPAEPPVPKSEVPAVEKLLQQLVRETQSRPPAVVSPSVPMDLDGFDGCYALSSKASANNRGRLRESDPPDETGPTWCASPVGSRVMQ